MLHAKMTCCLNRCGAISVKIEEKEVRVVPRSILKTSILSIEFEVFEYTYLKYWCCVHRSISVFCIWKIIQILLPLYSMKLCDFHSQFIYLKKIFVMLNVIACHWEFIPSLILDVSIRTHVCRKKNIFIFVNFEIKLCICILKRPENICITYVTYFYWACLFFLALIRC